MATKYKPINTEPCVECPECGVFLEPDTAEWRLVARETYYERAEWVAYLYEPCPGCGAVGEVY